MTTKHPHRWTDQERRFIAQNHDGTLESKKRLARYFEVSDKAISAQIHKIFPERTLPRSRPWTQEDRDYVARHYDGTVASRDQIAEILDRTPASIAHQITAQRLRRKAATKPWTHDDDQELEDRAGTMPTHLLAQEMHRTTEAVRLRARHLGIQTKLRDGWYTKSEVCQILGKGHKSVGTLITSGQLNARPHYETGPEDSRGAAAWHISQQDLKDFIIQHSDRLQPTKMDVTAVVEILAGISW